MSVSTSNTQHASPVLTESEAISWLRLDEPGGPRHPSATLKFYRAQGLLKGTRIGRQMRYSVSELEAFVQRLTDRGGRE